MNMFVSFQKGLHTNTKQTLEVLSLKRSLQNHPIKTIVYGFSDYNSMRESDCFELGGGGWVLSAASDFICAPKVVISSS